MKKFGRRYSMAKIVAFLPKESNDGEELWHVLYDSDDDEEDLSRTEVRRLSLVYWSEETIFDGFTCRGDRDAFEHVCLSVRNLFDQSTRRPYPKLIAPLIVDASSHRFCDGIWTCSTDVCRWLVSRDNIDIIHSVCTEFCVNIVKSLKWLSFSSCDFKLLFAIFWLSKYRNAWI